MLNLPKSLPVNPAAFPNCANVDAASSACVLVCPSCFAAVPANLNTLSSASPKICEVLEIVSLRSLAAFTAGTAAAPKPPMIAAAGNIAFFNANAVLALAPLSDANSFCALSNPFASRLEMIGMLIAMFNDQFLVQCCHNFVNNFFYFSDNIFAIFHYRFFKYSGRWPFFFV